MENFNDLFNLKIDDLIAKEEKKQTELFKPTPDKGKDGVYTAVIKFIPWYKNPSRSIIKKWTVWLVDPLSGNGRYIDCPSSIGEKSVLNDMFWRLKKSESVAEQKLASNFSRRQTFYSLVQVLKDDNNPELVGKILVWSYGIKIYNKIQDIMQPEFGTPHNPFDLFEGRPFLIKIKKVAGYNNYDDCRFLEQPSPIMVNGKKITERTPENMKLISEFLQNNSPDLSAYEFKPWDEETEQYVKNVIQNTVPAGRLTNEILVENSKSKSSQMNTAKETDKPSKLDTDLDDLYENENVDVLSENEESDDLWDDDIYNDIDF